MRGESIVVKLDEQISFSQLYSKKGAIWSLLMAAGYVKPLSFDLEKKIYKLALTNHEAMLIFEDRISSWFGEVSYSSDRFLRALLEDDLDEMNVWMNDISENVFSYFDTGNTSRKDNQGKSESFYHAFVLGIMVELKGRYELTSNSDSGYGRYDIMLIPRKNKYNHSILIEFKTFNSNKENSLDETCANALQQIYQKHYMAKLKERAISSNTIYTYGFAFKGKEVLICGGLLDRQMATPSSTRA